MYLTDLTLILSLILASFHVRLPATTDFTTWAHTEETLQQCCAAYGISHVTIAPEVGSDDNNSGGDVARNTVAQAACDNGSGCAVDDNSLFQIRKRIGRSVWRGHGNGQVSGHLISYMSFKYAFVTIGHSVIVDKGFSQLLVNYHLQNDRNLVKPCGKCKHPTALVR